MLNEIFKVLSDNTRLRILHLLFQGKTLCNCDLENVLEVSQVNISRHLSKLKSSNLILTNKKAQWVYCTLNQEFIQKYSFLETLFSKNIYDEVMLKDLERLEIYLAQKTSC